MLKIGITGQQGFLGNHLYNTLKINENQFHVIEFQRSFFDNPSLLDDFVSQCDTIVHLAALNRSEKPDEIYHTNLLLVKKLIASLERTRRSAHVLFSSSTQEENDNFYGRSKRDGRRLFQDWAKRSGGKFTGLIIPNVFGPFGTPYYNSVVATFCFQLINNEIPIIQHDGVLNLIYVSELVEIILLQITQNGASEDFNIPSTYSIRVSEILSLLQNYKLNYFQGGGIPELKNSFEVNLFNTFRSYINLKSHFPVYLKRNVDNRGIFVEMLRLNIGGQVSFSTTAPNIIRGNHFHTRKIERFIVIQGEAIIRLRKMGSEEVIELPLSGGQPSYVDMPIWYTHHIENIGSEELLTIFWINEFFDEKNPDTYLQNVTIENA